MTVDDLKQFLNRTDHEIFSWISHKLGHSTRVASLLLTMMMMTMSGFAERVINSPQMRCRSAK